MGTHGQAANTEDRRITPNVAVAMPTTAAPGQHRKAMSVGARKKKWSHPTPGRGLLVRYPCDDATLLLAATKIRPLHAEDVDPGPDRFDADEGVARGDLAGQDLEGGREHVEVAEGAVRDRAPQAEPSMNLRVHFSPEGSNAWLVIEVLDDGDGRYSPARDVLVVREPHLTLLGR